MIARYFGLAMLLVWSSISHFCFSQESSDIDLNEVEIDLENIRSEHQRQYDRALAGLARAKSASAKFLSYLRLSRKMGGADRQTSVSWVKKSLPHADGQLQRIRALGRIASLYTKMGLNDSAWIYLSAAENISDGVMDDPSYCLVKGDLLKRKGKLAEALEYFHRSSDLEQKKEQLPWQSQAALGRFYLDRGRYLKAITYYEEMAEQMKPDEAYKLDILLNLGICYEQIGASAKAEKCFMRYAEARRMQAQHKKVFAAVPLYLAAQAKYFMLKEDFKKALSHNTAAIDLLSDDFPRTLSRILLEQAICLEKMDAPREAIKFLDRSVSLTERVGMQSHLVRLLAVRSRLQRKVGNETAALEDLERHQTMKAVLYEGMAAEQIAALEFAEVNQDVHRQLAQLNTENQSNQLTINKRNKYILALAIAVLLLVLVAMLLKKQVRIRKRSEQLILEGKMEIQQSLHEKELLLQEVHHRIKNNLQFISSLLSLQSEHVDDQKALSALREGQDRVQSMALIHQNLYQEGSLKGVQVKSYFGKLVRNLFDSYNISPERIQLDLQIEAIDLDVDTMVPLGLIVNELVSNALKYAFPDNRSGTIRVVVREDREYLYLEVRDDGVGMQIEKEELLKTSFGYRLINAFREQLEGRLSINNQNGTLVVLEVNDYHRAA